MILNLIGLDSELRIGARRLYKKLRTERGISRFQAREFMAYTMGWTDAINSGTETTLKKRLLGK